MSASAKSSAISTHSPASASAPSPALGLESHHDREPADDHDSGGDRARAPQAKVESIPREQVAGDDPDPDSHSGRDREAGDRLRKRSGRHGPELGASASTKAGMPIVTVEAIVNWRGRSGKVPVGIAQPGPPRQ